jgi:hypothetical protein
LAGKFRSLLGPVLLLFFLGACASGGKKARDNFRQQILKGDYKAGLEALKDKTVLEDKKSRALLYLEEATALHGQGLYAASNKLLYLAKSLREKSYTKISQKLGTLIGNDNNEDYVGSLYEYSHLHFYLVLNHFLISQIGQTKAYVFPEHEKNLQAITDKKLSFNEVRQELFRARANLLAWDSVMKNHKDDRLGKSVFKYDLLAKIFGGFVHEAIGGRTDERIALNLYKDGLDILDKNYNGYPTYNNLFKKFNKDFEKFPALGLKNVKKNYVVQTEFAEDLRDLIYFKILSLTKQLDRGKYQRVLSSLNPSKEVKSRLKNNNGVQVCFILQESLIPELKADKFDIGLKGAIKNSPEGSKSFVANVGLQVLMDFAVNELGLVSSNSNSASAVFGVGVAAVAAYQAAISFELPKMDPVPNIYNYSLVVKNVEGKEINSVPVAIVNPIGDLAVEMVEKEAAANYFKTGARVALKHASAIASAYITYKAMNRKSKGSMALFAKGAAVLQYLGLAKAIEKSEKADTRYWSSLPHSIQMAFMRLTPGKYKLFLEKRKNQNLVNTFNLEDLEIDKNKKNYLINFSLLN